MALGNTIIGKIWLFAILMLAGGGLYYAVEDMQAANTFAEYVSTLMLPIFLWLIAYILGHYYLVINKNFGRKPRRRPNYRPNRNNQSSNRSRDYGDWFDHDFTHQDDEEHSSSSDDDGDYFRDDDSDDYSYDSGSDSYDSSSDSYGDD